ncbi:MAG: ABC transporter substrate-binding protein [Candidatus Cloacimonetes bacterium]|nr:ABC transporter substrate-binding protein [Candidatus Cloacimonadota bacterium]
MIFSIFLLFLIGCSQKETVFRTVYTEKPKNFDPLTLDAYANLINRNIYETLVRFENNQYLPVIANYWSLQEGLMILNINKNIRFSDGTFLTIEDVKKSLERNMWHPERYFLNTESLIDSLVIHDDNFLHIHFNTITNMLHYLTLLPIYKIVDHEYSMENLFTIPPIATGEYVFDEFIHDKIVLSKNKFHRDFNKNRRSPDIVEIFIESNFETQYQMFIAQEIDFLMNVPIAAYKDIFYMPDITIIERPSDNILLMFFNLSDGEFSSSGSSSQTNFSNNPLKDRRVRQAMASSIDIKGYIQNELAGKANLLVLPVLQRLYGYPVHLEPYNYDVRHGKNLMSEAGQSSGFKLNLAYLDGRLTSSAANLIKESLKEINIDVNLSPYSVVDYGTTVRESKYQLYLQGWSQREYSSVRHAINAFFSITLHNYVYFYQSEANYPYMRYLLSRLYSMNEYDPLLADVYIELSDLLYEEVYILPFYEPLDIYILYERFTLDFTERYRFIDFKVKR